jgi:hypothetical protein
MNRPQTLKTPKTGTLTIASISPGRAETNLMNPPTLQIQTTSEEKYSQSSNSKKSHKNQDGGSSFFNGLVFHAVAPSDNAAYVMTFMMSFQYWLGGEFANLFSQRTALCWNNFGRHVLTNRSPSPYPTS